jgi:peroxiredoxin
MKILSLALMLMVTTFFNSGYRIGDKVENFTLTNAIDNQPVSLHNYLSQKGVVVVFTSNYCPFSRLYEDRIIDLSREFESKGIRFILINSNTQQSAEESVAEMRKRAREKGYRMPYLADQDFRQTDRFGATKNPEVYVLESKNNSFVLRYKGAIDDDAQAAHAVQAAYLRDALNAIVSNGSIKVTEKRPVGCVIKRNQ